MSCPICSTLDIQVFIQPALNMLNRSANVAGTIRSMSALTHPNEHELDRGIILEQIARLTLAQSVVEEYGQWR